MKTIFFQKIIVKSFLDSVTVVYIYTFLKIYSELSIF